MYSFSAAEQERAYRAKPRIESNRKDIIIRGLNVKYKLPDGTLWYLRINLIFPLRYNNRCHGIPDQVGDSGEEDGNNYHFDQLDETIAQRLQGFGKCALENAKDNPRDDGNNYLEAETFVYSSHSIVYLFLY